VYWQHIAVSHLLDYLSFLFISCFIIFRSLLVLIFGSPRKYVGRLYLAQNRAMEIIELLEELLPIEMPFKVSKIEKEETLKEVHIYLEVEKSYRPNKDCTSVRQYYTRKWEHLKLFKYLEHFKIRILFAFDVI